MKRMRERNTFTHIFTCKWNWPLSSSISWRSAVLCNVSPPPPPSSPASHQHVTFSNQHPPSTSINLQTVRIIVIQLLTTMNPVAFVAPISSSIFPQLSLVLSSVGLFLLAYFFTMQVSPNGTEISSDKSTDRSSVTSALSKLIGELFVALIACSFLGFGLLFLALNVGLYV